MTTLSRPLSANYILVLLLTVVPACVLDCLTACLPAHYSACLPVEQSGPKASLYLTLVGILAGFMSTFWNLGYQRTSTRMQVCICTGVPLLPAWQSAPDKATSTPAYLLCNRHDYVTAIVTVNP